MIFEVLVRDGREITTVTITKDRTTIKIPAQRSAEVQEKVVALVKRIEDEVRHKFNTSMRGMFTVDFNRLTLWNNSRTQQVSFDMEAS